MVAMGKKVKTQWKEIDLARATLPLGLDGGTVGLGLVLWCIEPKQQGGRRWRWEESAMPTATLWWEEEGDVRRKMTWKRGWQEEEGDAVLVREIWVVSCCVDLEILWEREKRILGWWCLYERLFRGFIGNYRVP